MFLGNFSFNKVERFQEFSLAEFGNSGNNKELPPLWEPFFVIFCEAHGINQLHAGFFFFLAC